MMKRIKLLIVYPASDLGGGAQYILPIIRYLPSDRFDVHVAVFGRGPLYDLLQQENISTHDLRIDYSTFTFLPAITALRRFLRTGQYDVIHAHTAKGGFLCCIANKGLHGEIIYTGHVFRLAQNKLFPLSLLFRCIERFIYDSSAYVTVLSKNEYDFGISNGLLQSKRARIVSMSIDVEKFLHIGRDDACTVRRKFDIPESAFVVGMVGRLTFQKNPEMFVRIAATLNSQIDNIYFLWVGDGDRKEKTLRVASRFGISNKFIITGQQRSEDIPKMLSAMDVLLFTSRFEGLPIVLLEAMAAQKLIVAANVGGIQDIIKDHITGWLFDPTDYKMAARAVEDIYENRDKLSNIGKAAFNVIIEQYSPPHRMARELQSIYEEVVN